MNGIERPGGAFTTGSVEIFGHAVGWAAGGEGDDTLVICPGSAGSDASWAKDMLAERMRVVELNPPGWGGQEPLRHAIDQRDLAVVLAAAIDALGISRFHLHGASMGGVTALWLAVQFPDRVRTLSIEGGMNFVRDQDLVSLENVNALREMIATQNPDGTGYPRAAPHPRKPWSDDAFIRAQMVKRLPMMRVVTNRHEQQLRGKLADFRVPTLILLGDQDELLRPSHLAHWHEILPGATTCLVPGAAHDIQNTEPERFRDALMGHMARITG